MSKKQKEGGMEGQWYTSMFSLHLLLHNISHIYSGSRVILTRKGKRAQDTLKTFSVWVMMEFLFLQNCCVSEERKQIAQGIVKRVRQEFLISKANVNGALKLVERKLTVTHRKQFITAVSFALACYPNKKKHFIIIKLLFLNCKLIPQIRLLDVFRGKKLEIFLL